MRSAAASAVVMRCASSSARTWPRAVFEVGVGPAHRVVVGAVRVVCAWILHSQGSVLVSARFGVQAPAGRALVLWPPYRSA